MSRRTCANWSGSLAGGPSLPLPSRIEFSATRLDSRLRTLTPYLLYFSFASSLHLLLLFFIFRLLIPSLRPSANLVIFPLLFCITFPSFPLDSCCQLKPSCQPSTYPVLFPHSIPYHSTIPSHLPPTPIPLMSTKGRSTPRVVCCAIPIARAAGKVLVITSRKRPNYWVCQYFPPCLIQSHALTHPCVFFLTQSAERGLGVHRRCARGCCFERGLGRRSNPLSLYPSHPILTYTSPLVPAIVSCYSRRAWYNYALRDHHPKCRVHVPFL
jgi:hypothetical protein